MKSGERIYLASPHMSDAGYELQYIREAFETNWIAPLGKNVDEFEREVAALVGVRSAAALSSGTAAVHLALKAAGVAPGDTVFCSDLTFAASAFPIVYERAVPVLIDSDRETLNMSADALERAFQKYSPKAVVAVNIYGLPADYERIGELCRAHGAVLIEDAAESLGTRFRGRYTGTFGDYGVFSFNGNKIITTSGGGMLVSDDPEKIRKVRFWATQSRDPAPYYQHSEIGYNYRMSNILAGIGRGQLRVLGERIRQKKHIFLFYKKALGGCAGVRFMPVREGDDANCWLSCLTDTGAVPPEKLLAALAESNIEARLIWKPMHLQPVFSECDYIDNGGVSQSVFEHGLCLPSDTKMTDGDLERICGIIRALYA